MNAVLIVGELGIAPQNAYRSLCPLVDAGVLLEFTDRKRDQLWRAPEVLDALDAFAAGRGAAPTAADRPAATCARSGTPG